MSALDPAILRAHDEAVAKGEAFYRDPASGLMVMTAKKLAARGQCCGSGCRHCPYAPEEQARAGRPGSGG
jgi:hypothetical protein